MVSDDTLLPFWDHIEVLRRVVIRAVGIVAAAFVLVFALHRPLIHFLTAPAGELLILGPTDGLATTLRVCLWSALALTAPAWGYLVLTYVRPAISATQHRFIIPFLCASALAAILGLGFAYTVTIPLANRTLYSFNTHIGLNAWTLTHYLDYTVLLALGHAIAFELLVILVFLVRSGAVRADALRRKRRVVVVATLLLSALLTPPDVLTQCLLALPLLLMYEGIILFAGLQARGTQTRSC